MPPKADKLTQNLQTLQVLLQRKVEQYGELEPIIRQLKQIERKLQKPKLILQVISEAESLGQALFDLLDSHSQLKDAYTIKLDSLPDVPEKPQEATQTTISLQCILEQSTAIEHTYILSKEKEIVIGREPDLDIELDHPEYRGVSWNHAVIKPLMTQDNQIAWQLEDLNSTNGTYVDGKLITEPYLLQAGNTITLASPQKEQGIVQLSFNHQTFSPEISENEPYYEIIDCDVLLLVLKNNQALSKREKTFLQKAAFHLISKRYVVPELLESMDDFSELEAEITGLGNKTNFEVVPVYLTPYHEDNDADASITLDKPLQKRQDKFMKAIEAPIKRQPENILAARLSYHLSLLLDPVQILLAEEKQALNEQIRQQQQELDQLEQKNYKELTKKALSKANEDKDQFFKKVKLEINQSKAMILDSFSKKSIIYQIQDFVDSLQPIITRREGIAYIKLASLDENIKENINYALRIFCLTQIEKWAESEWQKVIEVYSNGGINSLIERLKVHLNVIPSLMYKTTFASPHIVDIKGSLTMSFAEINSEIRYKQASMLTYLMKEIRSNMMQYMMMLSLLLALVGIGGGKRQFLEKLSEVFLKYHWLLGMIVFAVLYALMTAYRADTNAKLEEASEKLRKEVGGYYQSLGKNLLDKIIQEFTIALDYESQKMDDTLASFQINYNDYIMEVEKQKVRLQTVLEHSKEKEKSLDKEMSELQKLTG